ncbi:TetR/AcrR family transcriptional regulator [Nocardioides eburneiflavus]|nr:TetR/AcrR family transcriptional regulator [Nocardioides eburneiflavus]
MGRGEEVTKRREVALANLLAAAIKTFAEHGFHGSSIKDVARAAGVSPAAIYLYADSKEELLYLISRDGHQEAVRVVEAAVAGGGSVLERTRRAVHDLVLHHVRFHTMSRVVNYELAALSREHSEEIVALRRQLNDAFKHLVDDGITGGDFEPPDRRMAVTGLMSLAVDTARWYHPGLGPSYAPEIIADSYAEMAVRMLTGTAVPAVPAMSGGAPYA